MRPVLALALLLASILAGCGGGSHKARLDLQARAIYAAQADQVCRAALVDAAHVKPVAQRTISHFNDAKLGRADYADLVRYTEQLSVVGASLQTRIHELSLPEGDPALKRWRDASDRSARVVKSLRDAAKKRNSYTFGRALERNRMTAATYVRLSKRLGFTVCGQSAQVR